MLSALRKIFDHRPERPAYPEHEIFAVGDIHGRFDLLEPLIQAIEKRAETDRPELIFLGDYIDRGPQSREVIELLSDPGLNERFEPTFLKGNHEATLLDFLNNPSLGPSWMQYGGAETLMSYKVAPPSMKGDEEGWYRASAELRKCLPSRHLSFFNSLKSQVERGCYLFAHAGVNPNKGLDEQEESDLLWIREAFLNDERLLPRIVVHGHTPQEALTSDKRRIGLDLGGYQTGKLGAARLHGGVVELFMSTV